MTLEGLFEPTVIFFELTNSLVTFQTIMNKILWDLINTGKVVSFIDDVIVETEKEEGHNEVVEKVVKRLVENNLYVKLKECKWKMREVGFLEVVIGLERIKMEKEMVKSILEWLTLKGVKDVMACLGTNIFLFFLSIFLDLIFLFF